MRGILSCTALCALLFLHAPLLSAQENTTEAKQYYKTGEEFQKKKQYKEAIVEFQKAYAISQQPVVLYAIAQCYRLQGSLEDALDFYREFLAAPKDPAFASYETSAADFVKSLEEELVRKGKKSQKSTLEGRYLDDANSAFVEKRYAEAIPLYAIVYQLSKRPFLLYYIGRCHFLQQHITEAEDYYNRYLQSLTSTAKPAEIDLKFQEQAEDDLAEIFFQQSDMLRLMTIPQTLPAALIEDTLVQPTSPQTSRWRSKALYGSLGASALTVSLLLLRAAAFGCDGFFCSDDQIVIEVP